jgi:hypothetical protein
MPMLSDEPALHLADLSGFGYGERLLVWTWRRMATGRGSCPLIAREFSDACGDDAAEVYVAFCAFLRALASASRRRLSIAPPGSFALTGDERQILTLLAAAQADHTAHFEAHLRWLAHSRARQELAGAARLLAASLLANRLQLVLPAAAGPAHRAEGAGRRPALRVCLT